MKYKELIETFEIIAKYDGGLDAECLSMWAEHDEHGISFDSKWNVSAEDLRKLAKMGWGLGCDAEFDEEASEKWDNSDSLSDEELVELFSDYNGIYCYE